MILSSSQVSQDFCGTRQKSRLWNSRDNEWRDKKKDIKRRAIKSISHKSLIIRVYNVISLGFGVSGRFSSARFVYLIKRPIVIRARIDISKISLWRLMKSFSPSRRVEKLSSGIRVINFRDR